MMSNSPKNKPKSFKSKSSPKGVMSLMNGTISFWNQSSMFSSVQKTDSKIYRKKSKIISTTSTFLITIMLHAVSQKAPPLIPRNLVSWIQCSQINKKKKKRNLWSIPVKRKSKSLKRTKNIHFNKKGQLPKNFLHPIKKNILNNEIIQRLTKTNFSAKKAKTKTNLPWTNSSKKSFCPSKKYMPIKETSADESHTEKQHPSSKPGNNKSELKKMSIKFLVSDPKSTKKSKKLFQQENFVNFKNSINHKKLLRWHNFQKYGVSVQLKLSNYTSKE